MGCGVDENGLAVGAGMGIAAPEIAMDQAGGLLGNPLVKATREGFEPADIATLQAS